MTLDRKDKRSSSLTSLLPPQPIAEPQESEHWMLFFKVLINAYDLIT